MEYSRPKFTKEEFAEIIKYVISLNEVSSLDLQLKFTWGYNRAGRAIDLLKEKGIISGCQYPKKRAVLISEYQDSLLNDF